ncbi:MAG: hypothetical protein CMB99_01000 [Flavobacteriaceae bacterium]|nr:hypothetical protein [Flavobacteriaceae bacterium]
MKVARRDNELLRGHRHLEPCHRLTVRLAGLAVLGAQHDRVEVGGHGDGDVVQVVNGHIVLVRLIGGVDDIQVFREDEQCIGDALGDGVTRRTVRVRVVGVDAPVVGLGVHVGRGGEGLAQEVGALQVADRHVHRPVFREVAELEGERIEPRDLRAVGGVGEFDLHVLGHVVACWLGGPPLSPASLSPAGRGRFRESLEVAEPHLAALGHALLVVGGPVVDGLALLVEVGTALTLPNLIVDVVIVVAGLDAVGRVDLAAHGALGVVIIGGGPTVGEFGVKVEYVAISHCGLPRFTTEPRTVRKDDPGSGMGKARGLEPQACDQGLLLLHPRRSVPLESGVGVG